eukprot:200180_1
MSTHTLDQTVYLMGKWRTQKVNLQKLKPVITNTLKICTWNIWFGNERQQLRMEHLLKIVTEDNSVDILCFQEVTQTLLHYILSHQCIRKFYLSGITTQDTGAYGNVIFSRFPLSKAYIHHYKDTPMSRKLVCVDIMINNELFRFGTVHLESLGPNARRRRVQLKDSMKFMLNKRKSQRPQHLMIMGDMNECGTLHKKELCINDKQFIDPWSEYHGGDTKYEEKYPGWTMPQNEYFPPWRPDRMYYAFDYDYTHMDALTKAKENAKGSLDSDDDNNDNEQKTFAFPDPNDEIHDAMDETKEEEEFEYRMYGAKGDWVLKSIKRVGMKKIPRTKAEKLNGNRITIFTPSDHYGLIAEFECIDTEMNEMRNIVQSRKTGVGGSRCSIM